MASPSPDNGTEPAWRNFPQDPSEFNSDPRISFSKLDDRFILETEDGQEFVYDSVLKRWVQTVWNRGHGLSTPLGLQAHAPAGR